MQSKKPLESEWLGNKGEQRFAELCANERLICNKSDRDLAGWDFLVNFPETDQQNASFDARAAPMSCYVQVKTIRDTSTSVSLKLNMAERLAKDPKPSFICILLVDENLEFSGAYLIHLLGDRLEKVLKRLRKEESVGGNVPLNKKSITFAPIESERFAVTDAALRNALESHCGEDVHHYIKEKRRQLLQLGFDGNSLTIKAVFKEMDRNKFFDTMLGRIKEVPIEKLEMREKRFGIDLSKISETSGKLTLVPKPVHTCSIVVRASEAETPAVFDCNVFVTPVVDGVQRWLLRHDLFSFIFDFETTNDTSIISPSLVGENSRRLLLIS